MVRTRLLATVIILLAFAACGGASHAPAPRLSADATGRLDAMPCPEGVDRALWEELKGALEEALRSLPEPRLSSRDAGTKEPRLENRDSFSCMARSASTAPTGGANRVSDLSINDNGGGTYTLSWHYRNLGDYDQNGVVALEDIYPLAEHFGEAWLEGEEDTLAAVIDGSGNGSIGIEDVTPIARNFQLEVDHYTIEGADAQDGLWDPVCEVAQNTGTGDGRLEYATIIQSPAALWHRVVAYDAEGIAGEPSGAVLRPSNEPIIYEVTPTEGYQHEECTFTATVTGAEPLTYAWDFGGGANPDTSYDISPTVTLSDAGEYEASLTVTNAYGEASFPFTLTVTERDIWAHTWGGSEDDAATDIALDSQGNVYVAGHTPSFGAGSLDVLLLKYTPTGELVFAQTWGGEGADANWDERVSIAIDSEDHIYVASETDSFGEEAYTYDALLLKYDADGNLMWAKVWGGEWIEHVDGVGIDGDGNVYVAGYRAVQAFASWDMFILKYSPDGELLRVVSWDSGEMDFVHSLAVGDDGSCYVVGRVSDLSAGGDDALAVSFDKSGAFRWARSWVTESDNDRLFAISATSDGSLHCAGYISRDGYSIPLLATFNESGDLSQCKLIDPAIGAIAYCLAACKSGRVLFSGICTSSTGVSTDAFLISCSTSGDVQYAGSWSTIGESREAANAVAVDQGENVYVAGASMNSDGTWVPLETSVSVAEIALSPLQGETTMLLHADIAANGSVTMPEGVLDTGGGGYIGYDVLILKNFPR